jgi:probable phosphoglycerate mutase
LGRADVPLNAHGKAQAGSVAASFLRPPHAIVSSPLARALHTARAIGDATGVGVAIVDGLIEMDVGDLEHLSSADLRERHPAFLQKWMSPECGSARMPGGETLEEVQERAWAAIEQLRVDHADREVVAVTHNFVILSVICRVVGLPLGEFRRVRHDLAARTELDVLERGASLVRLNDAAHLEAAGLLRRRRSGA